MPLRKCRPCLQPSTSSCMSSSWAHTHRACRKSASSGRPASLTSGSTPASQTFRSPRGFLLWDRVSLWNIGWGGAHSVAQTGLGPRRSSSLSPEGWDLRLTWPKHVFCFALWFGFSLLLVGWFLFFEAGSLHSLGWTGICYVDQAVLEFIEICPSISWMLELGKSMCHQLAPVIGS